jgi:hypothetical protein
LGKWENLFKWKIINLKKCSIWFIKDFKQFNILDSFYKNADNRPTLENFESDQSYDVIEVISKS